MDQPLVVIMDGDGEDLLGAFLADDVGIELFLELARGRDIGEERLGHAAPLALLVEDLLAESDAVAADVDISRTFDEWTDVAIAFAAERAIGVFLGTARVAGAHVRTAIALATPTR